MKKILICFSVLISTQLFAGTPGTIKWVVDLNAPNMASATLAQDENTLYVGNTNNQLVSLNTVNGAENWHYIFKGGIYSPPAYDGLHRVVVVTTNAISPTETGGAYSLQADTGRLIYSEQVTTYDNSIQVGAPALTHNNNPNCPTYVTHAIFVNNWKPGNPNPIRWYYLTMFDDNNPQNPDANTTEYTLVSTNPSLDRQWEVSFDANAQGCSEGTLTTDTNSQLGDVMLQSQQLLWSGTVTQGLTLSPPTVDPVNKMAYLGGSDGNLYAYRTNAQGNSVAPAWIFHLDGDLSQNPPAIGFAGRYPMPAIYVTSSNGYLYAVQPMPSTSNKKLQSGTLQWGIHLSNAGFASRPAVGTATGGIPVIYATDKIGNVYGVIDEGTSGLPESWGNPLRLPTPISSTPTLGYDGANQIIYLTSNSTLGTVYAVYGPNE